MNTQRVSVTAARERDIFLLALDYPAGAERTRFVSEACASDERLRHNVEELLREHDGAGDFLGMPAFASGSASLTGLRMTEKPGDRIGRYKLLEIIGEGGCGIVYMAEQEEPVRRRVALKVIKLGMDTRSVVARFEAERQALALMDHPNIARVLDGGATDTGRPYFVMELVRGVRITEYCDEHQLSTEDRLRLFIRVCQAIQHAHQKGIIHRDIKPSNILVTLQDGVPVPKVIDFGIAKATEQRLTEKTLFTAFHSFIGTPAYMSPEQAEMSSLDVDTRSDIYSLGVLLYELLTGRTPFDAKELTRHGLDQCRRTICDVEPARPSARLTALSSADLTHTAERHRTEAPALVHTLRGDLDWVVLRCLEKNRARRYDTAAALAHDVQRFLDNDTVSARPPTFLYQTGKLLARHRVGVTAAAAVIVVLVGGIAASSWQAVRATKAEHKAQAAQEEEAALRQQAERQRARAEQESAAARLNEYVADINLARQSMEAGNYGRAVQLLNKHRPLTGQEDLRGFEWRYLWQLSRGTDHIEMPRQHGPIQSLAVSPNGKLLAVAAGDRLTVYNIQTRAVVFGPRRGASSLAFLPDGSQLLVTDLRSLRALSTVTWQETHTLPWHGGQLALDATGKRAATYNREGVRIWDTATWQELDLLPDLEYPFAFSPDGKRIAGAVRSTGGIVVSALDGTAAVELTESTNLFVRAGFFRNDRALVFGLEGKIVIAARNMPTRRGVFVLGLWDATSGHEIAVLPLDPEHVEHSGSITAMAVSPDGRMLATASMDHSIRLWDLVRRQRIATLQGHVGEVWDVAFTPDGRHVVSGARDGSIKIWPAQAPERREDEMLAGARLPLGLSADGRTLAALTRAGNVAVFDLATRSVSKEYSVAASRLPGGRSLPPNPFSTAAVDAALDLIAAGQGDGRIQVWHTPTGDSYFLTNSSSPVMSVAMSPDATTLIATAWGREPVRWWDLRSRTNIVLRTELTRVVFSADSQSVALLARGNNVEIWDVPSRTERTNIVVDPPPSGAYAAFSPDGSLFAIVCHDDAVRLYDPRSGRLVGTLEGHKQNIFTVAFAPDGRTVVTGSDDSTVKFWNVATQQELLSVRRLGGAPRGLTFSADGRMLVAGSSSSIPGGTLRLFHAPSLHEIDTADTYQEPTPDP